MTTQFRGELPERIFGRFTSLEILDPHFPCSPGGYTGEEWSAEVGILEEREPFDWATVVGVPGSLQPGVAGNYRLDQGGAPAPFSGIRHLCGLDVAISGPGAIGISQVRADDRGDNVNSIPVAAGWNRLSGSKTLRTEFNAGLNHTVTTTTWTWSLTREVDLDYDGVPDAGERGDNCPPSEPGDPDSINPGQEDADGDRQGDACEVAKIVVVKQTNPDGSDQTFEFTGDLAGTIKDGGAISKDVEPGRYSTSELLPNGWDLESISCQDPTGDSSGDKRLQTATLNVAIQETVICTFTNTKRGHAKVVKTVMGESHSEASHSASSSARVPPRPVRERPRASDRQRRQRRNDRLREKLVPGAPYALCEIVMPGWMTTLGPAVLRRLQPERRQQHCLHGLQRRAGPRRRASRSTTSLRPVALAARSASGRTGPPARARTETRSRCSTRRWPPPAGRESRSARSPCTIERLPEGGQAAGQVDHRHRQEDGLRPGLQPCRPTTRSPAERRRWRRHVSRRRQRTQPGPDTTHRHSLRGISHDKMSATQTTQANAFATTLDKYNNNQLC